MQKAFTETHILYQTRVEEMLSAAINRIQLSSSCLRDAMRYATLGGGKRLRPSLVYATGETFGAVPEALDFPAAAVECIHCCSLIHDDLPAMDDDDMRRGKPTCHIAFDEATAILAGDALQILAFDLLSDAASSLSAECRLRMSHVLAKQAGAGGMIGGQSLDLLAEGKCISIDALENIHLLKTGALIRASVLMGALGAACDAQTLDLLDAFATRLGLAFQLQDDLLDVIGTREKLGKQVRQDAKLQKAAYPALAGINETKRRISDLIQEAMSILQNKISQNTVLLESFCDYLIARDH